MYVCMHVCVTFEALVKRAVRGAPDASCGAATEAVHALAEALSNHI